MKPITLTTENIIENTQRVKDKMREIHEFIEQYWMPWECIDDMKKLGYTCEGQHCFIRNPKFNK